MSSSSVTTRSLSVRVSISPGTINNSNGGQIILTGGSLVLWWALLAKGALALFAAVSRLWH